ncbi:MAG: response regulator [Deltaproteobacteria bacterium]|nr:response regulator [Deltaproteobacteria bacterium]
MRKNIPIRILLVVAFLFSGLIPSMLAATLSYSAARRELVDQAFRHLESVRDIKKSQIVRFFDERVRQVEILAADPFTAEALGAFEELAARNDEFASAPLLGRSGGRFEAGAEYLGLHARYAPFFETFARKGAYYDVFLIDRDDGFTLFTVAKEPDFGIRIRDVESPLRDVWSAAVGGVIAVSDTRPYAPSGGIPAQFIAAPVKGDGGVRGVVAVQVSIDAIDAIMRERSGMGRTGETYLVGPDLKMRSDSYLDPRRHSVRASFHGGVSETGVETDATAAALLGRTSSAHIRDYRGIPVLSAFTPVSFFGVTWAVVAEIDEAEIDARIAEALNAKVTAIIALSLVMLLLLAMAISVVLGHGVANVVNALNALVDKVLAGRLEARIDPEEVAIDFREVARKTNELVESFVVQVEERRKLEEAIQHNQRMEAIGTLAGGIAHDFNNILTYMYTYGELVAAKLPPGSDAEKQMGEIMAGIDRASELVSQIMLFGRQVSREKKPVRADLVVKEAIKLIQATLPRSIRVMRQFECDDIWLMVDPTQLHRVVVNLCTNAFQAMQRDGGVMNVGLATEDLDGGQISGLPAGPYCVLTVADTGEGIDDRIRARIFDPFFTTKPAGQGTGMGLAVVHGIVQGYSGTVVIDSRVGEGSTVRVYLPRCTPPSREEVAARDLPESKSFRGRILLVDDEAEILASTRASFESMGFSVRTAADGRAAEEAVAFAPHDLDLVLTDVNMPLMGGVELLTRLKRVRPDLPVVMMTGYSELMTDEEARALGAERIVLKPFRPAELARIIAEILGKRV